MRLCFTDDLLGHAVDESYYELSVLGDEMREAFDGTPEGLKDSIGQSRELAADILEGVTSPIVPKGLENQPITWVEKCPSPARSSSGQPAVTMP